MRITIRCPVNPTENPEKVRKAVLNIFPDADLKMEKGMLTGTAQSLDRFREILAELRIRDSARNFLSSRVNGRELRFSISKQAAYMGKISFGGLNPALGEIDIAIEDEDISALLRWLTGKVGP